MTRLHARHLAGLALLSLLAFVAFAAFAQQPVPPLKARVTDLTGTLRTEQKASIEQTLGAFEARKGSQIAVLLVPTTEPEAIEQYGIRVADTWKLGRKGVDDGAILIVAKNDRTMRIEVGYGLEGVLPDALAKRIVAETITPHFREGDFYGGISAGVEQMIKVIDGEPLPPPKTPRAARQGGSFDTFIPVAFMLVFVVGGVLRAVLGRFVGAVATGGVTALAAWMLIGALSVAAIAGVLGFLFVLATGGMGRGGTWMPGGFGGGGFGRGGFGGGGGGFSGGGGGFGGGGASGRW
jgi:uncharacterized protein